MRVQGLPADSAWCWSLYPADPETGVRKRAVTGRPAPVVDDIDAAVDALARWRA